jgi:UDP-glucose 4-epimerase
MSRTVLVTGGAGYIGSHTAIELLNAGDDVVVIDNFDNSSPKAIDVVRELTGRDLTLVEGDLADRALTESVFASHSIDAVIHFAGLKAVGESVEKPLHYYRTNLGSTMTLLEVMDAHDVRNLVFSSSCTVYGDPDEVPIAESTPLQEAASPYGRTKLFIEDMLRDVCASNDTWRFSLLRYFNPVGAHESGRIGEDPSGIPNNLMPFVMQVAVGKRDKLTVFGNDYETRDGTNIRDYIHVVDLAQGHLAALNELESGPGCRAFNLGTGTGSTVLEVIAAAEAAVGRPIAHEIGDRRPGDVVAVWADPSKATEVLGWTAKLTLDDMCRDHWRWQEMNPDGFATT